jgi:hypothetical protein
LKTSIRSEKIKNKIKMFADTLYSRSLIRARNQPAFAEKYWYDIDLSIESARIRFPNTIWIRQLWIPDHENNNTCCLCCNTNDNDSLVLRYRSTYPILLTEFIPPEEFTLFIREINKAMHKRDPCIDKCSAIAIFAILFYTTFIGIFFYMCIEHCCHRSRLNQSRKQIDTIIAAWNMRLQSRGIRIAGRWHAERLEEHDQPLDADGRGMIDYPLLCFVLPRPPTTVMYIPQQQAYTIMPGTTSANTMIQVAPLPAPQYYPQGYQQMENPNPYYPNGGYPPPPPQPNMTYNTTGIVNAAMTGNTNDSMVPPKYFMNSNTNDPTVPPKYPEATYGSQDPQTFSPIMQYTSGIQNQIPVAQVVPSVGPSAPDADPRN